MFLFVSYQPRWLSEFAAAALWLFVPPLACFATVIAVFNPMPSKIVSLIVCTPLSHNLMFRH